MECAAGSDRSHSGLMFAARITLPHFSVSLAMSFLNSAGEPERMVRPSFANRALSLGSVRPALISLLSLSICAAVFLGAQRPSLVIPPVVERGAQARTRDVKIG